MQKKVGDALYVLDLTPYVITKDTDVSIIYVQNEKMKEYKELNTELASKMHGFNQFIMAVQPLPWAEDGGDDPGPGPGPDPEPTGHTFTLSGSDIHSHVNVYFNNEQVQTTVEYTNVVAGTAIKITPEAGATQDWYNVVQGAIWDDNEQAWVATMPDSDLVIEINYNGEPQQQGHTLTLDGGDIHSHVNVYFNNEQVQTTIEYNDVAAGTAIKITPKEGLQPGWFGIEQGVEWDDNVQAWVATMPDEDYRITINYSGQPQTVLSWKYTPAGHDSSPTDFDINNSFMKDPRALANLNGENPIMPELYINNVPLSDASDFSVTYSTSNTDLITVDQNGVISPVESSEGEYSYGFAAVNVNVHDNTGVYADASTILRLELVHCNTISKTTAGSLIDPNDIEIIADPLILGDPDNQFVGSDCPVRFVNAYKDGVPYICSPEEYEMCGIPQNSTVSLWFDGDPSDITLKYIEDGMSDYNTMTYDTNEHWITFTMPNYDFSWTAVWNDQTVTVMTVTDDVGGHNGSNLPDEIGGWYYKFKYLSAPDSYTNEVRYGHDYEYLNYYGPNNFVFECFDGNGATVALEPVQDGYSFSMADDSAGDSYPGFINFFVSDPPFDGLTVYYDVQDETQPVTLLNRQSHTEASGYADLEYPALVYIDGQLVYDASNSGATRIYEYTFNTPGQHVVKYSFMHDYIPEELFYNIYRISEIEIGEAITEVKGGANQDGNLLYSGAFANCSGLTTVTMSDHISTIGASAFYGSTYLSEVTIYATNPPTMGLLGLGSSSYMSAIYVPGPSVTAYQNASGYSTYSQYITAIPGTEEESGES